MCSHSLPIMNQTHLIYDADGSSWMVIWSKPDLLNVSDCVVMLDDESRVVIVAREFLQANFTIDEDKSPNQSFNF